MYFSSRCIHNYRSYFQAKLIHSHTQFQHDDCITDLKDFHTSKSSESTLRGNQNKISFVTSSEDSPYIAFENDKMIISIPGQITIKLASSHAKSWCHVHMTFHIVKKKIQIIWSVWTWLLSKQMKHESKSFSNRCENSSELIHVKFHNSGLNEQRLHNAQKKRLI